jgi:hypothetical protein
LHVHGSRNPARKTIRYSFSTGLLYKPYTGDGCLWLLSIMHEGGAFALSCDVFLPKCEMPDKYRHVPIVLGNFNCIPPRFRITAS